MNWLTKLILRTDVQDTDQVTGLRGTSPGAESRWTWATVKAYVVASITKSSIGLGNVTNDAQVRRTEMGANNGVATLGSDGKVTPSQLPSATSTNWGGIGGTIADQGDLQAALDAKAASSHTHSVANVTGLQAALDAKSDAEHGHTLSEVADAGTAAALNVAATGNAASGEVVKGDDTRLTNSRTPTGAAGGVLSGTYPNPGFAEDMATQAELNAVAGSIGGKAETTDPRFPTTDQKSALVGTSGAPGSGNRYVTENDGRISHTFDVVVAYNGSGCATITTGSITNGTPTLTVASAATFKVNQGILVVGAGPGGDNLVTTITALVGNVATLAVNASTTVSNVRVQHDDTVAINAAIAAAFNNGGGVVYLTKRGTDDQTGIYRCNGPWNPITNSIITCPQTTNTAVYSDNRRINFIGECVGLLDDEQSNVLSGVAIESLHTNVAGSGEFPAVIGISDVSTDAWEWQKVDFYFDRCMIMVPGNPTFGGLQLRKCSQATLGDEFKIFAQDSQRQDTPELPDAGSNSTGLAMPGNLNNALLRIGSGEISGFRNGIVPGEHTHFRGTQIYRCYVALLFRHFGGHPIIGDVAAESCAYYIAHEAVSTGNQPVPIDLRWECEDNAQNFSLSSAIYDPYNTFMGAVRYGLHRLGCQGHWPVNGGNLLKSEPYFAAGELSRNGPLLNYSFDSTLNNAVPGGGYNLSDNGTITYGAGKLGNAAIFNGTTQWASNTLWGAHFAYGVFTVTAWIKPASIPAADDWAAIAGEWSGGSARRWILSINEDGKLDLAMMNLEDPHYTSDDVLAVDTWHFVVMVLDTQRHSLRFRVNGGSWKTYTLPANVYLKGESVKLGVGGIDGHYALGNMNFDGMIDDFAFFGRPLGTQEADWLYNGGTGRPAIEI